MGWSVPSVSDLPRRTSQNPDRSEFRVGYDHEVRFTYDPNTPSPSRDMETRGLVFLVTLPILRRLVGPSSTTGVVHLCRNKVKKKVSCFLRFLLFPE